MGDDTEPSVSANDEPMNPCPVCGAETEMGFGLAGGGYGVYLWCEDCEAVVSKTQCDD